MTWTYEPTTVRDPAGLKGLWHTVRRVRVVDTIDLGGVPGLGGMDEIEVDRTYDHGMVYPYRGDAREAADKLNLKGATS